MKKQIDMIRADSKTLKWIIDELKQAPNDLITKEEVRQGFLNLVDGITRTLMIDIEDDVKRIDAHYDQISCGDLLINKQAHRVLIKEKEVYLTPKEFDILYFLAKNRGEIFTKKQIYQAVWEDDYLLDDSNIMAFIRKLRKKIEPNPDDPIYILTIWGIGYKFNDKL